MKKTTITMLCLAACFAAADTKITWLADVTADRAETVTGVQSNQIRDAAAHIVRTDNPHSVTAAQIGAITVELDPVANAALVVHTNRTDNPHGVTAPQIGALTAEQDLAALAADRFLPIDAGKNVMSIDAGSGSIVTYSALIGDRAGNSITGANVIAIGRDAARKAILATGEEEADVIAIGENAAEEAGQLYAVSNAIAIGDSAFKGASGVKAIAIGDDAGFAADIQYGIAIGNQAGYGATLVNSTVIGISAGNQSSLTNSVAIGPGAGKNATGAGMLFIDSSGIGVADHPEYAMIYGSDVNLTLGKGEDFWPYSTNVLRGNWLFNNNRILTNETDEAALAALAAYAAYWPRNATASSWFTFVTNSGAITITGYNIAGGTDVVIPDYINGLPVTEIVYTAFAPVDAELPITSVSGGNVKVLGGNAFNYCYALNTVSFPAATTVGQYAFFQCISLTTISLPQVQTVGDGAFESCGSLASVPLPQVKTVGNSAFYGCTSLTSLYFDNDAPTIGTEIFTGIAPNQVTNYVTNPQATGWAATFGGMPGMPVVRLDLHGNLNGNATSATVVTGSQSNLIASAIQVESDPVAMAALTGYQSAAYWPPNATASSWFTFTTNSGAITITGYNIAGGTDVVIPDYINGWPVTEIGANAFMERGVTSIGGSGNVVTVGDNAFNFCISLTSVSLPQAQTVGGSAFYYCTLLTSVSLPQAQTVGGSAFAYCGLLASVYFDNDAPTIGADIFADIPPNQVTNYVTNPQATGWAATLDGMPVVRLPLYAGAITLNGDTITEWPVGGGGGGADLSDHPTFSQVAASNALPYTAWTGTLTLQDGTATVAYAHGNMPVLVVPDGGATTYVTVATGTYAATSGVSRVSLSIWAGTNAIELVTNEVDYATAPDIPTNGWGTILFRRVSDGRWKGVGL